jgi:hypothetical protein
MAGLISFAVAAWWAVPAIAPPSYGPPPALSQPRLIELKANRVPSARVRGLDASASSGGISATLFGGYLDAERIALFLRFDPPAKPGPARVTLRDHFGRSYGSTGAFADLATGENILYFEGPGIPLSITGLRLSLEIHGIERDPTLGSRPTRLALRTVLVGHDEWNAYALNMTINYAVLAAAGAVYLGIILGGLRLAAGRRRPIGPFARGLVAGVGFAVLALPTYVAIATLFRHDPVGPGGLQRPLDEYVPASMVAFFAIEAAAILTGAGIAARSIRPALGRSAVPVASAVGVLAFLALTLPLVEFANACYIGHGFLLRPQC